MTHELEINARIAAPGPQTPAPPWKSRIRRSSDGRFGTVTGYDADLRVILMWDGAIIPERRSYSPAELAGRDFDVFPAGTHCSDCGEAVDEDDVDDGYTTCCNEPACGPCAAVGGAYACGTEAPTT